MRCLLCFLLIMWTHRCEIYSSEGQVALSSWTCNSLVSESSHLLVFVVRSKPFVACPHVFVVFSNYFVVSLIDLLNNFVVGQRTFCDC